MWVAEVLTGTLELLSLEPWLEGPLQAALPRLLQKELDQAFPLLLVQVVYHLVVCSSTLLCWCPFALSGWGSRVAGLSVVGPASAWSRKPE